MFLKIGRSIKFILDSGEEGNKTKEMNYSSMNLNAVPLILNQYSANPRRSFHFKALSLGSLVDCFSYVKSITRLHSP